MYYIRWTGLGILFLPLFALSVFAAVIVADKVHDKPLGVATFAGMMVLCGVLSSALGWLLNRGSGGHSFGGLPVEYSGIVQAVIAWIAVAAAAGIATDGLVGWLVFLAPLIALVAVQTTHGRRIRYNGIGGRQQYAAGHGWRYVRRSAELAQRFKGSAEPRLGVEAYGLVSGEIEDVPFTAWDVARLMRERTDSGRMRTKLRRRTAWAAHLPAEFGTAVHRADSGLASGDRELAAALWTDQVSRTTRELDMSGWFLHGRDLVLVREVPANPGYFTPEQIGDGAAALVRLVRSFPADLPSRHGVVPRQGIPLRQAPAPAQ